MNVGLIDVDSKIANLALMKISAYHKKRGDNVEWYTPFSQYDIVYMSKVFAFTPPYAQAITNADIVERGGTGYDLKKVLPKEIDMMQPDYSIYPKMDKKTAYGFLTRGCPNKCKWCVVPIKEGNIHPYMDVDDIAIDGRTNLVLMDNNILACDYGLEQIEKIVKRGYRVDFNQALDARLVTEDIALLLSKVKWLNQIRFGCDTPKQIKECERAMQMIDSHCKTPKQYLLYTMIYGDINECYDRLTRFKENKRIRMVAQPFRDFNNPNQIIPQWQKDMAHWTNKHQIWKTCDFKDFSPRKGFVCKKYFNK